MRSPDAAPVGGERPAHDALRLPEWLRRRADLTPQTPALIYEDRTWTFRDLERAAQGEALRLYREGVRRGDHVALLGQNSPGYIVALCALMRLGAVAVPLNVRLRPPELAWQIADARAKAIVADPAHMNLACSALAELPAEHKRRHGPVLLDLAPIPACPTATGTELFPGAGPPAGAGAGPSTATRDTLFLDEVQGIIYTSGTTGKPKGAMLTYGNHWWNAVASGINLGGHGGDVWLAAVPLFHVSGLSIVMRALIHGFTVLLHERFDPAAANRAIDHQGVTLISVVAVMLDRMLQERGERPYPPGLKAVLVGGGPVPQPLLKKALDLGMPVLQTYGMTETASQAATLPPHDALRKPGSAGKPLFPVEMRIDAPLGEIGEILVRGPSVSPGYFGRPQESEAARQGGWLRTGDLGYFDDEGYLYVVDRRTDLIISGGENVYPAEVEAVLHGHPAVREAGVAGKPDPRWGQVPVAFVVPSRGPGFQRDGESARQLAHELLEYCRGRLAGYKVPVEVHFVEELPRNAAGKVARHRLAELLAPSPADAPGEKAKR